MGHLDFSGIGFSLPDGTPLLKDVSFRVPLGVTALIGPNGSGKTTLMRIAAGVVAPHTGSLSPTGSIAAMPQFIGSVRDDRTVRDLLLAVSPESIHAAAEAIDRLELAMINCDGPIPDSLSMKYAERLADWTDLHGYDWETRYDVATVSALNIPFDIAKYRSVSSLSGGEQKRLILEFLLSSDNDILLLDEPDNYLDVPSKLWLEEQLRDVKKAVLLVSHDRELITQTASRIVTLEPGAAGATAWVHGGSFKTYHQSRIDRNARLDELRRRWDEDHVQLKELVDTLRIRAKSNSGMATRYQAARTRLARFESDGPPQAAPVQQRMKVRFQGGRTAKRAVTCVGLELTGLTYPFDLEVFYGQRLAVVGMNGSGKSHFLRLLAAGGTQSEPTDRAVGWEEFDPVQASGSAVLGSRVRPGYFRQTHVRPELVGRSLLEILHNGDEHRDGVGRETASRVLDRYGLAARAETTFDSLSGGQQARFQILLLELSGVTLLLLDEPTDNLDLYSSERLEEAIAEFDGSVIAVTHDRTFARIFDSFLIFDTDGIVSEVSEPLWESMRN